MRYGRSFTITASLAAVLLMGMTVGFPTVEAGQPDKVLTWIVDPEPSSIVPIDTSAGGNGRIGPKVVEGLLTYDFDLNPKPLLATEWSISEDGLSYSFKLRRGVKWHDGHDFTSADVAFSILTLKSVHPRGRGTFASVTDVLTPDPYTAVIVLSKPAPYLLTALAATESPIVPKHLYVGRDISSNPLNSAPIGTGPFIFKEWVRGSHIVLERNPNYWDSGKPLVDRIIVRFIPDVAARAAALETGQADLGSDQPIPLSDVERFQALPNLLVDLRAWPYAGNHRELYFNLDTPALQNIDVRRAIAHAIDVDAFVKTIWYGYGTISASPIGKGLAKFNDDTIKPYKFDRVEAERLLDAGGLKRGAGGVRLKLRLLINPYQERRAADFVRQALAAVGIDAVVEAYDFATYIRKVYTERAFDLTIESLANTFDPTIGVQRIFWSKNYKVGLPFSNVDHYSNPEVDRLLEAAAIETDPGKRRQLFLDFQQIVNRDVASIEFGDYATVTVVSRKVHDYAPTGEGTSGNFSDITIDR